MMAQLLQKQIFKINHNADILRQFNKIENKKLYESL